MKSLLSVYQTQKASYLHTLAGTGSLREASEETEMLFDRVFESATETDDPVLARREAGDLLKVLRAAGGLMVCANRADVSRISQSGKSLRQRFFWGYLAPVLALALFAWLFLNGQPYPSFLALVSGLISFFAMYLGKREAPDQERYETKIRVGVTEADRRIQYLLRVSDQMLLRPREDARPGEVSRAFLEVVQKLFEASQTGDGAFALKTIPALENALSDLGIRMEMYSDSLAGFFDLLPGEDKGFTIRPALLRGERLLLRGQAIGGGRSTR